MQHMDLTMPTALDGAEERPVALPAEDRETGASLKIDTVVRAGTAVLVAGWCTDPEVSLGLAVNGEALDSRAGRLVRPDVARALGAAPDTALGFAVFADLAPVGPLALTGSSAGAGFVAMLVGEAAGTAPVGAAARFVFDTLAELPVGARRWNARLGLLPQADHRTDLMCGSVDFALLSAAGGAVSGWEVHADGVLNWLEDDRGPAFDLASGYRWQRPDVAEAGPPIAVSGIETGFLRPVPAARDAHWFRLAGCSPEGRFVLPQTPVRRIAAETRAMAEALFEINSPRLDFTARARAVELPVLARIRRAEKAAQARARVRVVDHGPVPEAPDISVIVPLYGRTDMVENQLLEFAGDPEFGAGTELIYVIDDPRCDESFRGLADRLQRICGPAFRTVSAGQNRGYSGANNLGAETARGDVLIFANSDVFPRAPGWTRALAQILDENPGIGIVAPRLLFPDGSLQHAGMKPVWRPALDLWTNHHPLMGMDPDFDPAEGLCEVPLVTGACVALRRGDFEAAGGWNTDYIIGDFEDSDLCFSIRELGLATAYAPDIALTHLERQSMPGLGEDGFRERVTLVNAALYNRRWHHILRGFGS